MRAERAPHLSRRRTTVEVLLLAGLTLGLAIVIFASVCAYFDTSNDDDMLNGDIPQSVK